MSNEDAGIKKCVDDEISDIPADSIGPTGSTGPQGSALRTIPLFKAHEAILLPFLQTRIGF